MDPKPIMGLSQYVVFGNNPIVNIDPNGDIIYAYVQRKVSEGGPIKVHYGYTAQGGYGFYDQHGQMYQGNDKFIRELNNSLGRTGLTPTGRSLVDGLMDRSEDITIHQQKSGEAPKTSGGDILWNAGFTQAGFDTEGKQFTPPWLILAHEMGHVKANLDGEKYPDGKWESWGGEGIGQAAWSEILATHIENKLRSENGMALREYYGVERDPNDGRNYPATSTRLINGTKSVYMDKDQKPHYKGLGKSQEPYDYKNNRVGDKQIFSPS